MIRIILVNLLLLLLPLIVYFSYIYLRSRTQPDEDLVANAPIFWLLAGGAAMMLIALFFLVRWETGDPEARYVPPRYEDGVIVPGHYDRNN